MGCDIHLFVEVRRDGVWTHVGKSSGAKPFGIGRDDRNPFDVGRNYNLFAILAGVRNDAGVTPIAPPKGMPKDASSEVRKEHNRWGVDGHSATHFTLAELHAFDWTTRLEEDGIVGEREYKAWMDAGKPPGPIYPHCKGVGGGGVVMTTNAGMEQYLALGMRLPGQTHYTSVRWGETLADAAEHFVKSTMPALAELGSPEDVRIVAWFDN